MLGTAGLFVPSIEDVVQQTIALGRLTNPAIRCAGISLNTSGLDREAADAALAETAGRMGLPAADPIRGGPAFQALLDACQS
jgi:uncharacterized NAD-dependent epimerase/dehydratase family protein